MSSEIQYNESYRPQFHFTPPSKWMNDPNGLVYFKGRYHLFYQYNPDDIVWGPMHWGHASSDDLFHWKHHPIALCPDTHGKIFSGSIVIDKHNSAGFGKNVMIAIFTHHNDLLQQKDDNITETQSIAYSLDEGLTWKKYLGNPVIDNSCEKDFRDPKVFWNDEINKWNMVLASGDRIKIYSSTNLIDWEFKSDFKQDQDLHGLGVWECPDIFKLKFNGTDKWVMIISHNDNTPNGGSGTRYYVGDFNGEVFKNVQPAIWLDYGTDSYAGITFSNVPNNRRIYMAWMSNWMYAANTPTKNWRGAMTLAKELILDKDDNGYLVRQQIVKDFNSLRRCILKLKQVELPYLNANLFLSQAEILFEFSGKNIQIIISDNNKEYIQIESSEDFLSINRKNSGRIDFSEKFAQNVQIMQINEQIYHFQLILDRSSIEILLNNGKYSMTNIFFSNSSFTKLELSSSENVKVTNLEVNKIERVW